MSDALAIGVDVGATKIASALVARDGSVLAARQTETRVRDGGDALFARIAAQVNALASQANAPLAGVGVGAPGWVNPAQGVVLNAVNMNWENVALAQAIQTRLAVATSVYVQNDVKAAALGEWLFGAARGARDFFLLTIGSGLGSAAMANGALLDGAQFLASELGHLAIDPHGRLCNCGHSGCAETVLSGRGLIAETRAALARGIASQLRDAAALTTHEIIAAALQDDAAACAALQVMGEWLGIVIASGVAWLNPARVILGGGLGIAAYDVLMPIAQPEVMRRVLPGSDRDLMYARVQVTSSAVGAAALAFLAE
ncbi:MAG: ROK family protein [Chloroflexi bacterium]|nr:ROK family protein [Chloroflexota bacterium]